MPAGEGRTPPGVFATIATAFSLLLVQPWPMLLPIAVDLWLWQGPRVSPAAIATPLAATMAEQPAASSAMVDLLRAWGSTGDLSALVGWLMPSLLAGVDRATIANAGGRVLTPDAGAGVLIALLALLIGAVLMMTLKTLLGRAMRALPLVGAGVAGEIGRNVLRYLGYLGLLVGLFLVVLVPCAFVLAFLQILGINLIPLFGFVASLAIIAGAVLLSFVSEAIVVAGVGPVRAARLSMKLVRAEPWTVLGFLATLWVALLTVPQLLDQLTGNVVGVLIAIGAAAFLTTGLELARLQFFFDRWKRGFTRDARPAASAG